jgi:hypothetical protein
MENNKNKSLSKMNKKELYELCKEQQDKINLNKLYEDDQKIVEIVIKLKEEIEKLKVKNIHYEAVIESLEEDIKEQNEQANIVIDKLIEDYNKLKKEIEKLKDYLKSDNHLNFKKLKEENEELKEKNEFISKVKEDYFKTIEWKNDMIIELEKEKEELQQQYNKLHELF